MTTVNDLRISALASLLKNLNPEGDGDLNSLKLPRGANLSARLLEEISSFRASVKNLLDNGDPRQHNFDFRSMDSRIRQLIGEGLQLFVRAKYCRDSDGLFVGKKARIENVRSLDEFVEKSPLHWIPTKVEIKRLLDIALTARNHRLRDRDRSENSPALIVDVGGGTGALGKLLLDAAKENREKVEIVIVDPHEPSLDWLLQTYGGKSSGFTVFRQSAQEFARRYCLGLMELSMFSAERSDPHFQKVNRRADAVQDASDRTNTLRALLLPYDLYRPLNEQISDPATLASYERAVQVLFAKEFMGDSSPHQILQDVIGIENKKLEVFNKALERSRPKPAYDMVINSFMLPGENWCRDIEALAAPICVYIHALEGVGVNHPEGSNNPTGDERSHLETYNFPITERWSRPGFPDVAYDLYLRSRGLDSRREDDNPTYLDIRVRSDLSKEIGPSTLTWPESLTAGRYPWEDELVRLYARNFEGSVRERLLSGTLSDSNSNK